MKNLGVDMPAFRAVSCRIVSQVYELGSKGTICRALYVFHRLELIVFPIHKILEGSLLQYVVAWQSDGSNSSHQ